MATGLELYFNETRTLVGFDGAYTTYLTCTANRVGKAGAKNFFIIAHISTCVASPTTTGKVRLRIDGVDYGECADGLLHSDTHVHGYTYNFIKRISLDASSHSITLDCGRVAGAIGNFDARNASIVVLEESANAQYAEREDEAGTAALSVYLNLQFTAPATGKYLLIWSCETKCMDESDADVGGISFQEWESILKAYLYEGHGELVGPANDNIYRTVGGAAFEDLIGSTQYTFNITMIGGGVGDEVYCRKGYIIAIPFSDFENVYSVKQSVKSMHTTAQSDTSAVLAAQACNAADHLVIAGADASNESPADVGFPHLISAGPVDFPAYNLGDRDEDAFEYYVNFLVHGVTLVADNYDFKIQGDSSSDSNEGCVSRAYLMVCEIPPITPPPTYIPQVMMVA